MNQNKRKRRRESRYPDDRKNPRKPQAKKNRRQRSGIMYGRRGSDPANNHPEVFLFPYVVCVAGWPFTVRWTRLDCTQTPRPFLAFHGNVSFLFSIFIFRFFFSLTFHGSSWCPKNYFLLSFESPLQRGHRSPTVLVFLVLAAIKTSRFQIKRFRRFFLLSFPDWKWMQDDAIGISHSADHVVWLNITFDSLTGHWQGICFGRGRWAAGFAKSCRLLQSISLITAGTHTGRTAGGRIEIKRRVQRRRSRLV